MLFTFYGYQNTYQLWNIPTISPHFGDLRTITHGAESYAHGFDPMVNNPSNPWNTKMNYPRIWQSLYFFGLNHNHTTIMGSIIILSFLVGICLILPNANNKILVMVFAAVLSPASLLGAERGNIDLLMFFFASLSILLIRKSHLLAVFAIMTGFLLKLFPIFGAAIILRLRKKFVLYTSVVFAIVLLYIYMTLPDLILIKAATPKATHLSYGINVFWMRLADIYPNLGLYAKISSYSLVLFVFLGSCFVINTPLSQPHYCLTMENI